MSESYRPQIERALRFIGDHLDRPLTVAEVAKVAYLSEFHFHRIFSAVMGEPVGRYITRKRLEVAALRLAYEPECSVTQIGHDCGYSSTSNFTKAFSAFFGVSPTNMRKPNPDLPVALGKLTRTYHKQFHPSDLHVLPAPDAPSGPPIEPVRFEACRGIDVACLASPEGYDFATVSNTWRDLIARGRQLGICGEAVDAYGMAFDSPQLTAPELCRYHACVPCPSELALPAPLFHARIPEGRYAVFAFAGAVAGVEAFIGASTRSGFPRRASRRTTSSPSTITSTTSPSTARSTSRSGSSCGRGADRRVEQQARRTVRQAGRSRQPAHSLGFISYLERRNPP